MMFGSAAIHGLPVVCVSLCEVPHPRLYAGIVSCQQKTEVHVQSNTRVAMRTFRNAAVMAVCSFTLFALSFAQQQPAKSPSKKPAKTGTPSPAPTVQKAASTPAKTTDSIISAMDKSADPCTDFYQFACGNWTKDHPIPSDRSAYNRFSELYDNNQKILHDILDAAAKGGDTRSAVDQKIGDFYSSCLDESKVNAEGIKPIQPMLDKINALQSKSGLITLITALHKESVPVFFNYYSQEDFKNASQVIANVDQGGISLPSRDFYTDADDKSKSIREKYLTHVTNMLKLSGDSADQAAAGAQAIMKLETALAESSLTPVEQRDPKIQYNIKTVAELQSMAPAVDWSAFIAGVGTPKIEKVNLDVPKFAEGMQKAIDGASLDDLKTYLRWHVIHAAAPYLSENIVNENFDFYSKQLNGVQTL